ncbi:MAG: GTPase Era [Bradymonadia bacterium]
MSFKCGFVTLLGRPNAGKSTLLNRILGEKVAITSHRPQTTRNRIPGVLTREADQMIFIDTPGIHHAERALNTYMVDIAHNSIADVDVIALLIEVKAKVAEEGLIGEVEAKVLERLAEVNKPVFLVLNKIDRIDKMLLLPMIDQVRDAYPFTEIVPISALKGDGVEILVESLAQQMPESPALYPEDALTDLPERFIVAEIVREKLFQLLEREVPYATAVTIETWQDRSDDNLTEIQAVIHVERDSQKSIVIGRGGQMIKEIGTRARRDIERLLGTRVHLKLFARVEKGWTRNASSMRKLGYE